MSKPIEFLLKPLTTKPKFNATLAERRQGIPALMESRKIMPASQIAIHADFDGDGERDSFELQIQDGPAAIQCSPPRCTLWAPRGAQGISKLIPGDLNQDGLADFYLETIDGSAFSLENVMDTPIRPILDRNSYRTHLLMVALISLRHGHKGWWDAVRQSIALTAGLSHTWVAQEPKPRYPWLEGTPPHTDCVIDLERTLAELHALSGNFNAFQRQFNRIQKYDFKGPERTDFFTVEAVPHLIKLGMLQDLTDALWAKTSARSLPTFQATINKENWYKASHNGQASGKDFPEWQVTLGYIPFDSLLVPTPDGSLRLHHEIAAALPPVSIFVVMNKGRIFKTLGTEIPDSHVGYLIKDPKTGEVYVHHSTPTSDLNMATATSEDFSRFMQLRYCQIENGKVVNRDKTAVGVLVLAFLPPRRK